MISELLKVEFHMFCFAYYISINIVTSMLIFLHEMTLLELL